LDEQLLDRFSLGEKPAMRVKNNHLSLLAMVDCWWKLGIVPYDHMICSTPVGVFLFLFFCPTPSLSCFHFKLPVLSGSVPFSFLRDVGRHR
jgi:hypothetical protein